MKNILLIINLFVCHQIYSSTITVDSNGIVRIDSYLINSKNLKDIFDSDIQFQNEILKLSFENKKYFQTYKSYSLKYIQNVKFLSEDYKNKSYCLSYILLRTDTNHSLIINGTIIKTINEIENFDQKNNASKVIGTLNTFNIITLKSDIYLVFDKENSTLKSVLVQPTNCSCEIKTKNYRMVNYKKRFSLKFLE